MRRRPLLVLAAVAVGITVASAAGYAAGSPAGSPGGGPEPAAADSPAGTTGGGRPEPAASAGTTGGGRPEPAGATGGGRPEPAGTTGGGRPEPAVYLALGDSVAAGVGATPDAATGYVSVLYDTLTAARPCGHGRARGCRLELVTIAQPGATTTSLIAAQLPTAVGLITSRRATRSPVDDVRLITLDIGGNDVFSPVVSACAADPQSPTCASTIATQLRQVDANYARILGALRTAAGPDTTIAVMAYYNPLPGCQLAALSPLAELVLEGGGPVPAGLNDIIRARAAEQGAVVVETAEVVGTDDLVGGADCLHPDNSGHADIAAAFAAAIDVQDIVHPRR